MATTAEFLGIQAAAHELPHMGDDDADVLVDPRMGLSFYGLKMEKDAADSPSQFMLTPRMFGSDLDGNPIDYLGELPAVPSDESVLDPGETIEVAAGDAAAAPPMVSPPDTASRTSPSSQPPPAAESPRRAAKRQPAAPAPPRLKRTRARAAQQLKRCGGGSGGGSGQRRASSKGGGSSGGAASTSTAGSKADARRSRCLERNRVAASKCREKKKQWVHDLESTKCELEQQHASLQAECAGLLEEATQIKNWLMGHAGCGDAKIDAWIGNEAMRFVQRSGSGSGPSSGSHGGPSSGSHGGHGGHGGSRHSSIGSLASIQSRSIAQSSSAQTEDTHLSSPPAKPEPMNYDYMPDEMFQDTG
ncbi:Cyclic AMP-dependent transcription factor ATF-7 [Tolypocladium capitatum]|uniref:Cyclic AMP-dependent transcription factor ATF-7 n=1 Tax=Tolypocladium capitatum TaxID=45235 RepID=A0A2K3Q755_9HYPO|nr:Cyclic AMP-dependent transcription factor ATF-7 [Tolypocladium capitatum]